MHVNDLKTISGTTLFSDIPENKIDDLIKVMKGTEMSYRKGELILMAGNPVTSVGIMLSGNAQIMRENAEGNRLILSELARGDLFGEAYAAAEIPEIPIAVMASTECRVLWIPFDRFIRRQNDNEYQDTLIRSMMRLIGTKNVWMNEKMRLLSCRTTKEKLLMYLMDYAERIGKTTFKIPFSRQELADYLSVDRSAMSRELGKLRDEGYVAFYKNEFTIKKG